MLDYMKYINKLLIAVFSFSTIILQASNINILNEDWCHIEYSIDGDNGFVCSTSIINKDIKDRIEIIVKKIEASKNLNEKHTEIISLSLSSQLSVELDVLKLTLIENLEYRKKRISIYWEDIHKSSDAEDIKSYLTSIDIEEMTINLINNCFDWMEKLKNNYCNFAM